MRTALLRPLVVLVLFVSLLSSSFSASAATPFVRALQHGRRYVHRPIYKQYQRPAHKSHGLLGFLQKK